MSQGLKKLLHQTQCSFDAKEVRLCSSTICCSVKAGMWWLLKSIKEWQETITEYAVDHGFNWNPNDIDTMLLRIHSEVSEASEAARDENMEELAEEMADIFIRLANACEVMGIDLESEVAKKHSKNLLRQKLHGRKRK